MKKEYKYSEDILDAYSYNGRSYEDLTEGMIPLYAIQLHSTMTGDDIFVCCEDKQTAKLYKNKIISKFGEFIYDDVEHDFDEFIDFVENLGFEVHDNYGDGDIDYQYIYTFDKPITEVEDVWADYISESQNRHPVVDDHIIIPIDTFSERF